MKIIAQIPKNRSEEFRVTAETFKGTPLVHLRVWYMTEGGDFAPSHKGVAMHPDNLPEIIAALQQASTEGVE